LNKTVAIRWLSGDGQNVYLLAQRPANSTGQTLGNDLTLSATSSVIHNVMGHFNLVAEPSLFTANGEFKEDTNFDPLELRIKIRLAAETAQILASPIPTVITKFKQTDYSRDDEE